MMDYSQAYYAAATQPPYQFVGGAGLVTAHPKSVNTNDYNRVSPPNIYEQINSDQFQFDPQAYVAHFGQPQQQSQQPQQQQQQQHHAAYTEPSSPPHAHPAAHTVNGAQHLQGSTLNRSNGVGVAHEVAKAIPQPPSSEDSMIMTKPEPNMDFDASQRIEIGSDDEEMTPAQSRRKAQNRAAQRAFRERKERHVKDLEVKLAALEASQNQTSSENEKLKRQLQKVSTENEILRATSTVPGSGSTDGIGVAHTTTGPLTFNPVDFYSDVLSNHDNKLPSHRIVLSDAGEKLYAAGATWDYILGHPLFQKGMVDIADISNRLKTRAKCDGQGPVFEEASIREAIEESVGSGSDELL